jgi:hypothetical protein
MRVITAAAIIAFLPISSAGAQNVPNWANDSLLEEIVVTLDNPIGLPELTVTSDVIVEASVLAERSFLDPDGSRIWTDYRLQLTRALKVRDGRGVEATLTVRRRGGTLKFGSRAVVSTENDFLPFQAGEQYVLFLRKTSDPGVYGIVAGRHGAVPVTDGVASGITPLVKFREAVMKYAQLPAPVTQGAR